MSASALHLGLFGPRRAKTAVEYTSGPPPYELVDNEDTMLRFTDLVLVDAVGMGYSYATNPENSKDFWNYPADLDSFGEFIRLYRTRYAAGGSPLFIAGDSYGTIRAAGMAKLLLDRKIPLSGVILISTGNLIWGAGMGDSPVSRAALSLPSYTASAYYHKKLPANLESNFLKVLRQAETWARTDYTAALSKGDHISKEERDAVVRQLARFTGLDPDFIRTTNLGIGTNEFAKNLLRDQDRELSWFNANVTAKLRPSDTPYDVWSNNLIREPTSTLITPYLRDELGFKTNAAYYGTPGGPPSPARSGPPFKWDWAVYKDGDAGRDLAEAMRRNTALRLFVAQGYYDLLTPYVAGYEAVRRLGVHPAHRRNIMFGNYMGGHLMYMEKPALTQLTRDIGDFIRKTSPLKGPIPSVQ